MNKRNITCTLAIALSILASHFNMDIFHIGVKDGKATANHIVYKGK